MVHVASVIVAVLLTFAQAGEEREQWYSRAVLAKIKLPDDGELITARLEIDGVQGIFVLDTGCMATILNDPAARRDESGKLKLHDVSKVVFEGLPVADVKKVAHADLSQIAAASDTKFDGIIGADVLFNYLLYLDPDTETLYVCDSARVGRPPGKDFALSQDEFARPTIEFSVGKEKPSPFIIDTGMTAGWAVEATLFDRLREDTDNRLTGIQAQSIGIGGKIKLEERIRVSACSLGDYKVRNAVVKNDKINALGLQALSRFKCVLDFPTSNSYWSPAKRFDSKDRGDCCGMSLTQLVEGNLLIAHVEVSSEAEKIGLMANDEILTINGIKANTKTKGQWHRFLSYPTCETIKISVKRNSSVHLVELQP